MNRRRFLAGAALALTACGGGGGGNVQPIPVSKPKRVDLLYGYFGQDEVTVLETAGHANTYWAADFNGFQRQMAGLTIAKGAGFKNIVLSIPYTFTRSAVEGEARFYLKRLADEGLLENVRMVPIMDEPTHPRYGGISDAEVRSRTKALRGVLAEFSQLAGLPVSINYDGGSANRPGMTGGDPAEIPDWVGLFHYHNRCGVTNELDDLKASLAPHQRLIAFPFGASGEGAGDRLDPACIVDYALTEPRVAMVAPFIWQSVVDGGRGYTGIRVDPQMRVAYEAAGRKIG